ncbi:MAG: 2Fe-2S iron-sulfur cluster-binding protein [Planctomycetota bacterium]
MKHFTVIFEPDNRQVSIHEGATLTEAAGRAGIILNSVCGGKGVCRKCLVVIQPQAEQVPACRYHVESDITVTVPATSRFFGQRILTEGATQTEIKPDIYRKYVQTAAGGQIFGVAVDIGTTTVVAKLVNMTDGQCEVVQAAMNPQARYGDDVISRISYGQSDDGLSELHEVIIDCINGLIGGLCRQGAVQHNEIYEMSVVGNTTMNHIFLKLPVAQLGQAPYKAFSLEAHDRGPEQMGLEINAAGNIHNRHGAGDRDRFGRRDYPGGGYRHERRAGAGSGQEVVRGKLCGRAGVRRGPDRLRQQGG